MKEAEKSIPSTRPIAPKTQVSRQKKETKKKHTYIRTDAVFAVPQAKRRRSSRRRPLASPAAPAPPCPTSPRVRITSVIIISPGAGLDITHTHARSSLLWPSIVATPSVANSASPTTTGRPAQVPAPTTAPMSAPSQPSATTRPFRWHRAPRRPSKRAARFAADLTAAAVIRLHSLTDPH